MAHANEAVVRKGYDAFSRGDMDTLRELFDENIVWHVPGRSPLSGDHKGVDAVLQYFMKSMELSGGTFRVEVHDVVANDEHTVGIQVVTGERNGKQLNDQGALIFHIADGKVTEVWQLTGDLYSNDDFFS
jgi:uncharacterized protein